MKDLAMERLYLSDPHGKDCRATEPSQKQKQPVWFKYAVGIGSILIAFSIRFCLTPVLGEELPFMLFIAAVLVAAWAGGAAGGLVALFLGFFLAGSFFVAPEGAPVVPASVEVIRCVRYLFTGSIGVLLIELLHRGRRRTQAAVDRLEQEVIRRHRSEEALIDTQAELAKHADELEQRVTERTAKLAATVQSLEDLLYHIAHNLRAPLRAMEGYATLLRDQIGPHGDAAGYSARISEAARRMDTLINDLLRYGRLGHVEITLAGTDLEQAVRRVLCYLTDRIKATGAEIKVIGPLASVQGNATLLEHVLCTLLDNAIKFVNPGTRPVIQIWTEQRDGNVRLCVRDNGIGIEPQYHQRIFRPFERLHSPQAYEGTGIGLAIVKEGMKRMNGQAGVQSAPGQGSLFWLEFARGEEIHEQRLRSPGLGQSMSVI